MGLIWITPHKRSAVRGYNASILQNPAVGSTFKTIFNLGVPVRKSGKNMQLENLAIYELTDRLVQKVNLRGMVSKIVNDVSRLSSATYMVLIKEKSGQTTELLIKE